MARMTKEEKALEKAHDAAFSKNCSNVQFDIMDLGKMHKEWNSLVGAGKSHDDAMIEVRQKYRKN
jgi:hypothetical protein